jgi:hypothetical protein
LVKLLLRIAHQRNDLRVGKHVAEVTPDSRLTLYCSHEGEEFDTIHVVRFLPAGRCRKLGRAGSSCDLVLKASVRVVLLVDPFFEGGNAVPHASAKADAFDLTGLGEVPKVLLGDVQRDSSVTRCQQ